MHTSRLLDGRLKLRHLLLVDALSERGSVVGAAAALHVTQPVVTRGLHDLESILGVTLYDRGPRGITPTEFGAAFTEHARAVLAQMSLAVRHVEEIADATRGEVVIGTHLAGASLLVPRAIADLKRDHPFLTVTVREGTPESLRIELAAGRVDLVVGRLVGPAAENTRRKTLYEERIRFVAGHHHPLAGRDNVSLEALADYPWILPGNETMLRQELDTFMTRQGITLPRNRVETTSFLIVRQLLVETEMIGVLPSLVGADDPRLTDLAYTLEQIGHSVGLTVAADRRLSPAVQALLTSLHSVARDLTTNRS